MEKVRGPGSDEFESSLYELSSLTEVRKRFETCYNISRREYIDLTSTEYAGCVYVLECKNTSVKKAEHISRTRHRKQSVPWWVAPANDGKRRLYVGRAKKLPRRVWQHIRGSRQGGAHFTEVFPPLRLKRVFLFRQHTNRDEIEAKVTQTVDRENPEAFIYSDRYDTYRGFKEYGENS